MKQSFLALPYAVNDKRTPWYAKAVAVLTFAYGCSPIDLIPDFIPVIGYLDDLIIVPLGIYFTIKLTPENIWRECILKQMQQSSIKKPKNYAMAVLIIGLWISLGYFFYRLTQK